MDLLQVHFRHSVRASLRNWSEDRWEWRQLVTERVVVKLGVEGHHVRGPQQRDRGPQPPSQRTRGVPRGALRVVDDMRPLP